MSKTPKLRFPEFSGEWENVNFKDIFVEVKDKTSDSEKYPLYSLTIENGVIPKSQRYEREFLVKKTEENYKIVTKNQYVYNPMNLRFGAIARYNGECDISVSGYYNIFKSKDEDSLEFLDNFLKTNRMFYIYNTIATGSLIEKKRVHFSQFIELSLPMPSKQEQQKIASFLSLVDKKIEKQSEKVEAIKEYKKGMMQKIFSREIRFKDDEGKEFPEWEEKKLGDICSFFSGGTPSTKNKTYYNGSIPFIRSAEISSLSTELYITNEGLINSSAKLVNENDLLYALYGATSGEVALSKISGAINQAVLCIRSNHINLVYLMQLFKNYKDIIVSTYIQGGQGNLSANIIKELRYLFPTIKEQQKIANFLSTIDKKLEKEEEKLEALKTWKKGLLQQMFV